MFTFGVAVEVIAVTRDQFGDRTEAVVGTIPGCGFAPDTSTENTINQAQVGTDSALYVPPTEVPVTAQHRLRFDGQTWQINGEVAWWRHPMTGWSPGGVIRIRRVTG